MHVAGNPHHPELNGHKHDRQIGNSTLQQYYLRLASFFSKEELSVTVLRTHRPATIASTSHTKVPIRSGPIWFMICLYYRSSTWFFDLIHFFVRIDQEYTGNHIILRRIYDRFAIFWWNHSAHDSILFTNSKAKAKINFAQDNF